jgi:N-formylglutamate deformylase
MTDGFTLKQGTAPLLISMPHVGTELPGELARRMTPDALPVADTDWHLEQLYDFAESLGASVLVAQYSRYVVDLNRPPDNANLYPGRDTTGLCPVDTFDKRALYLAGEAPTDEEIAQRVQRYWNPYHQALQGELQRLREKHGHVRLWDAHSIRCEIPRLFEGRLHDLNFGTADGASCSPAIAARVMAAAARATGYSSILNGRFKGGYITRRYGNPAQGIEAMQLEMTQIAYMSETPPYALDLEKAKAIRPYLREMVQAFTV